MSVQIIKKLIGYNTATIQKPKKVLPVMEDFLRIPVIFYHNIGLDPYDSPSAEQKPGILFYVYFVFNMINLAVGFIAEIIFVVISFLNKENFLESCMVVSYIGFVVVSFLNIFEVFRQKKLMTSLARQLDSLFPPLREEKQEQYKVGLYLDRIRRITKAFVGIYMTMVVTFNLYHIVQYGLQRLRHYPDVKKILPYTPFEFMNHKSGWFFALGYLSQIWAAYTAVSAHISADLMIFSVTMQVIMHFDCLSKTLSKFEVREATGSDEGTDEDLKELRSLIAYHNQILGVFDVVNEVFGIPLLLNFGASSILICFVGFQMTVGLSSEHIAKLSLVMASTLTEIYLLCYFSQMLIDSSERVAFAVYDMKWWEADLRFRKMLVFISLRAQRPVCLKATIFLDISTKTMCGFLRTSYQFLCAIRTMYQ